MATRIKKSTCKHRWAYKWEKNFRVCSRCDKSQWFWHCENKWKARQSYENDHRFGFALNKRHLHPSALKGIYGQRLSQEEIESSARESERQLIEWRKKYGYHPKELASGNDARLPSGLYPKKYHEEHF